MKISTKQREVLGIIAEYGSECWGDVWSRCDYLKWGVRGTELANFERTAKALVRKGFVREADTLEITDEGREALR